MTRCDEHTSPTGGGPPKTAFHSAATANAHLHHIRKRGERQGKKPTRAYLCPSCGRWFLTSSPA